MDSAHWDPLALVDCLRQEAASFRQTKTIRRELHGGVKVRLHVAHGTMQTMRIAVVQMTSTDDVASNLQNAAKLVHEAAEGGATWISLPENFAYLRREGTRISCAQSMDGEIISTVRGLAVKHSAWLLAGSFPEHIPGSERIFNTSVLISPDGAIRGQYRKLHLFDVALGDSGGGTFTESATVAPGNELVVVETPFGGIGMSICYDLRFPELYRGLIDRGARWLTVPAAFTQKTGEAHWEILLRARAIENQAFVVAPAQGGTHHANRKSYGHSMIVDPWGRILAEARDVQPGAFIADCKVDELESIRGALPCLQHRRILLTQDPDLASR